MIVTIDGYWRETGLLKIPTSSISIFTMSPWARGSVFPGVPVKMISPGHKVTY